MFDLADIRRLLDAFDVSEWDELHLVSGDSEIHLASSAAASAVPLPGHSPGTPTSEAPSAVATTGAGAEALAPGAHSDIEGATAARSLPAGTAAVTPNVVDAEGAHAVVSPSPGLFWRSPSPGEPPFVDVGQRVTPGTPVAIVEVMKLMNHVLAGVDGTVRAVLVENGRRVERDQLLVLIDTD